MKLETLKYKQMSKDDMAHFLCELVEDVSAMNGHDSCCNYCPVQNQCHVKHNGFLDWLDDENV